MRVSFFSKLYSPANAAKSVADKQKSQLLSGLLLVFVLLMALTTVSQLLNHGASDYRVLMVAITTNYFLTYLVSRTRYYQFAAYYFIAQMMMGTLNTALAGSLTIAIQCVVYFVFAILLSSILLTNRATLIVAFLSTVFTVMVGHFNPQVAAKDLVGMAIYIFGAGLLSFLSASIQKGFVKRAEDAEQEAIKQKYEAEKNLNQINTMLQSMDQGILVINSDLKLDPNYSLFLETILEDKNLGGISFQNAVLGRSDLGREKSDMVLTAISNTIGENSLSFEVNIEIFPKSFALKAGGKIKIIDISFNPICINDIVIKILVSMRDVTEIEALRIQSKMQDEKMTKVFRILKVGNEEFQRFMRGALDLSNKSALTFANISHKPNAEQIASVFRYIHTIKGNARTLGFNDVSSYVHELEDIMDQIRKDSDINHDVVIERLSGLSSLLHSYQNIYTDEISTRF